MAAIVVTSPYTTVLDLAGQGLSLGSVYVGAPNQDPQVNPQAVFWDPALTIPATQPLQVSGGYVMRLGTPAIAYTAGDYSIRALDHLGVQIFYSPTSGAAAPAVVASRTLLTANADFFVTLLGNDATGTGSAGSPWATIQKAFNVLQASYDLAGFIAFIHVGAGTFAGATMSTSIPGATFGGGSVQIIGTGAGTIIQGASGQAALVAAGGGKFSVQSATIGGAGAYGLRANSGGGIGFSAVTFAAVSFAHIFIEYQGVAICTGNYTVSGSALAHFSLYGAGATLVNFAGPYVCTLVGTPAFAAGFARASDNAVLLAQNSWLTFSGAATGPRYNANANGTIDTNGSGASYFPGGSAGSVTNAGIYI